MCFWVSPYPVSLGDFSRATFLFLAPGISLDTRPLTLTSLLQFPTCWSVCSYCTPPLWSDTGVIAFLGARLFKFWVEPWTHFFTWHSGCLPILDWRWQPLLFLLTPHSSVPGSQSHSTSESLYRCTSTASLSIRRRPHCYLLGWQLPHYTVFILFCFVLFSSVWLCWSSRVLLIPTYLFLTQSPAPYPQRPPPTHTFLMPSYDLWFSLTHEASCLLQHFMLTPSSSVLWSLAILLSKDVPNLDSMATST